VAKELLNRYGMHDEAGTKADEGRDISDMKMWEGVDTRWGSNDIEGVGSEQKDQSPVLMEASPGKIAVQGVRHQLFLIELLLVNVECSSH